MQATEESTQTAIRKPDAAPTDAAGKRSLGMANAARQVVLRRVAPALRHDMVVNLQALAMLAEMLNARAERGTVTPADLQANLSKLNRLSRQAVAKCLDVASWMEVTDEQSIGVQEGVQEVVGLLAASFNFRGFGLQERTEAMSFEVTRHTMRSLLAASLIAIADRAARPCNLVVRARVEGSEAVVTIAIEEREDQPEAEMPPATHAAPRPNVEWDEVQALARAESATAEWLDDGSITLRMPRAVVTSPLQMAPV